MNAMDSHPLEHHIESILERNARVEREKAWEQSFTRRAVILLMTYLIVTLFLWSISIPFFYLQALVPTLGYFLSTLSLPWIKECWMKRHSGQ